MELPLIVSATLLGLAGAPHCAAMCSAPCAAARGSGPGNSAAFHVARVAGYAAGGALAAASVAVLAGWSQWSPALRPLWVLLHVAALALGLWLLIRGQQPAWMSRVGSVAVMAPAAAGPTGWQRMQGPGRAAVAGGLWVAWPCGLLQSALLVAAMGSHAATGALAMGGFALASAPGLLVGPWAWKKLRQGGDAASRERLAVRAAGALLAAASSWALGHGMWQQIAAFCGLE